MLEFEPETDDDETDDIYYHIDALIKLDLSFLETLEFDEYKDDEETENLPNNH